MKLTVKEFKERINEFNDDDIIDVLNIDDNNDEFNNLKCKVVGKIWDIRKDINRVMSMNNFYTSHKNINMIKDCMELISGLYRECLFLVNDRESDNKTKAYIIIDKVDDVIGVIINLLNDGLLNKDRKTKCKINGLRDSIRIINNMILGYRLW